MIQLYIYSKFKFKKMSKFDQQNFVVNSKNNQKFDQQINQKAQDSNQNTISNSNYEQNLSSRNISSNYKKEFIKNTKKSGIQDLSTIQNLQGPHITVQSSSNFLESERNLISAYLFPNDSNSEEKQIPFGDEIQSNKYISKNSNLNHQQTTESSQENYLDMKNEKNGKSNQSLQNVEVNSEDSLKEDFVKNYYQKINIGMIGNEDQSPIEYEDQENNQNDFEVKNKQYYQFQNQGQEIENVYGRNEIQTLNNIDNIIIEDSQEDDYTGHTGYTPGTQKSHFSLENDLNTDLFNPLNTQFQKYEKFSQKFSKNSQQFLHSKSAYQIPNFQNIQSSSQNLKQNNHQSISMPQISQQDNINCQNINTDSEKTFENTYQEQQQKQSAQFYQQTTMNSNKFQFEQRNPFTQSQQHQSEENDKTKGLGNINTHRQNNYAQYNNQVSDNCRDSLETYTFQTRFTQNTPDLRSSSQIQDKRMMVFAQQNKVQIPTFSNRSQIKSSDIQQQSAVQYTQPIVISSLSDNPISTRHLLKNSSQTNNNSSSPKVQQIESFNPNTHRKTPEKVEEQKEMISQQFEDQQIDYKQTIQCERQISKQMEESNKELELKLNIIENQIQNEQIKIGALISQSNSARTPSMINDIGKNDNMIFKNVKEPQENNKIPESVINKLVPVTDTTSKSLYDEIHQTFQEQIREEQNVQQSSKMKIEDMQSLSQSINFDRASIKIQDQEQKYTLRNTIKAKSSSPLILNQKISNIEKMNERSNFSKKYENFIKEQDTRTILNLNKATQIRHFVESIASGNFKQLPSAEIPLKFQQNEVQNISQNSCSNISPKIEKKILDRSNSNHIQNSRSLGRISLNVLDLYNVKKVEEKAHEVITRSREISREREQLKREEIELNNRSPNDKVVPQRRPESPLFTVTENQTNQKMFIPSYKNLHSNNESGQIRSDRVTVSLLNEQINFGFNQIIQNQKQFSHSIVEQYRPVRRGLDNIYLDTSQQSNDTPFSVKHICKDESRKDLKSTQKNLNLQIAKTFSSKEILNAYQDGQASQKSFSVQKDLDQASKSKLEKIGSDKLKKREQFEKSIMELNQLKQQQILSQMNLQQAQNEREIQKQKMLFDQERQNWLKKQNELQEEINQILENQKANSQYEQFQKINEQIMMDIEKDKKIELLQKEIEQMKSLYIQQLSLIEKREYSKDENYSSLENRRLFEQASFQEDLSRNRFNKVCTFQNQMIGDEKSKINQISSSANSDFTDEIQEVYKNQNGGHVTHKQTYRTQTSTISPSISPHISAYVHSKQHTNIPGTQRSISGYNRNPQFQTCQTFGAYQNDEKTFQNTQTTELNNSQAHLLIESLKNQNEHMSILINNSHNLVNVNGQTNIGFGEKQRLLEYILQLEQNQKEVQQNVQRLAIENRILKNIRYVQFENPSKSGHHFQVLTMCFEDEVFNQWTRFVHIINKCISKCFTFDHHQRNEYIYANQINQEMLIKFIEKLVSNLQNIERSVHKGQISKLLSTKESLYLKNKNLELIENISEQSLKLSQMPALNQNLPQANSILSEEQEIGFRKVQETLQFWKQIAQYHLDLYVQTFTNIQQKLYFKKLRKEEKHEESEKDQIQGALDDTNDDFWSDFSDDDYQFEIEQQKEILDIMYNLQIWINSNSLEIDFMQLFSLVIPSKTEKSGQFITSCQIFLEIIESAGYEVDINNLTHKTNFMCLIRAISCTQMQSLLSSHKQKCLYNPVEAGMINYKQFLDDIREKPFKWWQNILNTFLIEIQSGEDAILDAKVVDDFGLMTIKQDVTPPRSKKVNQSSIFQCDLLKFQKYLPKSNQKSYLQFCEQIVKNRLIESVGKKENFMQDLLESGKEYLTKASFRKFILIRNVNKEQKINLNRLDCHILIKLLLRIQKESSNKFQSGFDIQNKNSDKINIKRLEELVKKTCIEWKEEKFKNRCKLMKQI